MHKMFLNFYNYLYLFLPFIEDVYLILTDFDHAYLSNCCLLSVCVFSAGILINIHEALLHHTRKH